MKFTTPVPIQGKEPKIDHHSKVFLIGSCFVENIGEKFDYYQFQNFRNPFGILYHPFAIENLIVKAVEEFTYSEEDVFFHNERWHCFEAHSELSDVSKEALIGKLNDSLKQARKYLIEADHIIVTPGTAWVYKIGQSKKPVANCHKVPQKQFSKEISEISEIQRSFKNLISAIKRVNSGAQIILTVSPVRHLKDGFVENHRSKAHLISAVHSIIERADFPLHYFPSFEIVMDELRDYRFYGEDMIHPGKIAIDFIWQKFAEAWVSPKSSNVQKEVEQIRRGISHRPFNAESVTHKSFQQKLEQKIRQIQSQFPHIQF